MTNQTSLAPLRNELIATCELLRFDQLDPLGFVHTDEAFRIACGGEDALFGLLERLDDAYDPAGYARYPIPQSVRSGLTIWQLHRAAHVARTRTFEPFFEWLAECPQPALVVLLAYARAQIIRFHLGGKGHLPFPLTSHIEAALLAPELLTHGPRDVAA